jgi:hypothetical protein
VQCGHEWRAAGLISRLAPVSRGRASSTYERDASGRRPLDFGTYHRNFLRPGNDLTHCTCKWLN